MIIRRALVTSESLGRLREDLYLGVTCLTGLLLLWFLMLTGQLNLVCALTILSALVLVLLRSAVDAALLTLGYLHVLGDVRRIADLATGVPRLDLLLLIGPCMAMMIAIPVLLKLQLRDALSRAMLILTLLMTLEAFNPAQGGLAVGFSGILFCLVPILWFWIGRGLGSIHVIGRLLYGVIFPLAVLAAVLGLWQTLVGFFPFEQAWIDATLKNYTALSLGGSTRAFGFSVSSAEYATLLEVAAAGVASAFFTQRRTWALAFPLLVTALLLASGRTVVVRLVLSLAAIWTLKKQQAVNGVTVIKLAAIMIIGLTGVSFVASLWVPSSKSSVSRSATQESMAHLSGGLAHPFDERYSTAEVHEGMFINAIGSSFRFPLGHGLGATTVAATKFSGSTDVFSSEIDVSDMFVILGPVGGLLYVFIVCAALRSALKFLQDNTLSIGLPVFAILLSTVGAWLISGQYSTSALIFFLMGATTRPAIETYEPAPAAFLRDR